ncbi:MAG: sigma 54-interacting transcriptional regulator [Planctomycetota bacterium]
MSSTRRGSATTWGWSSPSSATTPPHWTTTSRPRPSTGSRATSRAWRTPSRTSPSCTSCLLAIADAQMVLGETDLARECAERSHGIWKELGSRLGEARSYVALGKLHSMSEQHEESLVCYGHGLEIARQLRSPINQAHCLSGIAEVQVLRGEYVRAIEALESALPLIRATRDKYERARIHELLCRAYEGAGDTEKALEHFREYHGTEWEVFLQKSDARLEHLRVVHELEQARHEAREAEDRAIRRSAAMFNAIVENTPNVAIHGYDVTGNTRLWNRAAGSTLGFRQEEVLGKSAAELFLDREGAERFKASLRLIDRTGVPVGPDEWECRQKGGAPLTLLSTVFPIVVEGGEKLFVRMDVDLTERRKAETALRKALDEVKSLKDRLEAENVYLREEIQSTYGFEEIVGESDIWKGILFKVEQVAATDLAVLLLGETGTGKELIAHAIHDRSRRKDRPLVKVNCAAIPASLVESELFGHEKGAFTGAFARKDGRFDLADGGTIFLDEVGELPPDLQVKLLRVLQEGEFQRLGSTGTRKVDVRVLAATNRDLESSVEKGEFRLDLYYRLKVFPIEIPPLRDRPGDLPLLVWHFVRKHQATLGKTIERIPQSVLDALAAYHWPGNVRELENVLQRAMLLSPGSILQLAEPLGRVPGAADPGSDSDLLEDVEREHMCRVLEVCGWKVKGTGNAAERLGLNPSTLRLRMKKLGITRPT